MCFRIWHFKNFGIPVFYYEQSLKLKSIEKDIFSMLVPNIKGEKSELESQSFTRAVHQMKRAAC